jgi:phage terminase small subunit
MTKPARPEPPESLESAGKRAWKALLSDLPDDWELTARETELLRNACRQADLVADLEAALEQEGVIVVGAAGQRRLNAVATELRQSRIALARLLGEIPIPDDDGEKPTTNASQRGQKAAQARWKKQGRKGPADA